VTTTIPESAASRVAALLETSLCDGFFGQAYSFDDNKLTEEWMTGFSVESVGAKESETKRVYSSPHESGVLGEDDVRRTLIECYLDILVWKVQDRVCSDLKVLDHIIPAEDLREIPVWGMDSNTRHKLQSIMKERIPDVDNTIDVKTQSLFLEQILLPAINCQDPTKAYDIKNSLQYLIEKYSHTEASTGAEKRKVKLESQYGTIASVLLCAVKEYGIDQFPIHPKGTGVVCVNATGIPPHSTITQYLGELYPPYR